MHIYPRRASLDGFEVHLFKLVSYGATQDQWAEWLRVPLEHAAARGNLDLFDRLLRAGANGSAGWRGCRGRTLLDAAALGGNSDLLAALIRAGAGPDVNVVSVSSRRSALYTATFCGHEAAARQLIRAGADVNFEDPGEKRSVLHKAVWGVHHQLVGDLLEAGADPNIRSPVNCSAALHWAALFGHNRMVSSLLMAGAVKDALSFFGHSPLMWAVRVGNLSVVEKLLDVGVDLNIHANGSGSTALHYAAQLGYSEIVCALLLRGADKDALDVGGDTPLMRAVINGHQSTVDTLLESGADLNIHHTCCEGGMALHFAAERGHDEMVSALLLRGASKDALDFDGRTPLMWAVWNRHLSTVQLLLESGADLNIHAIDDGSAALHVAADTGHDGIMVTLLLAGADPNVLDSDDATPLMRAAGQGEQRIVDLLIHAKADVNISNTSEGSTALHEAAREGHYEIVCALLLGGAEKDALAIGGVSSLMRAVEGGHLSIVKKLLQAGAGVHTYTADEGCTALHWGARGGHDGIVSALLLGGADKDALDSDGKTPLMWAIMNCHLATMELLLNAEVNLSIEAPRCDGGMALHRAVLAGKAFVSALLLRGVDVNCRLSDGTTALQYACQFKRAGVQEIVEMLLKCGADETAECGRWYDSLGSMLDDQGFTHTCSQDEVDRVRTVLARAPAERAWRRRGWLVMLRSQANKRRGDMNRAMATAGESEGSCNEQQLLNEHAAADVDGSESGTGKPGSSGSGRCEVEQGGLVFSALVIVLVGLASEDTFRTITSFL